MPDVSWDDIGALKRVREELEWSILVSMAKLEKPGALVSQTILKGLQSPVRNPADFAALGLSTRAQGILLCGPPGESG